LGHSASLDKCFRFAGALALAIDANVYHYIGRNGKVIWSSEEFATVPAPAVYRLTARDAEKYADQVSYTPHGAISSMQTTVVASGFRSPGSPVFQLKN
jgi:hypothetical protein